MKTRGQRSDVRGQRADGLVPLSAVRRPPSSFSLHPSSLLPRSRGFTLVELLVVIAIIAILAALLLPALNAAMRRAEETQARTEAKSIETAVKAYLNEYGKFPHGSGAVADYTYGPLGTANLQLMNTLRSIDGLGNVAHANNLRKIVLVEVQSESLSIDGNFMDPWDQQYEITVDANFDNSCLPPAATGYGTIASKSVIVWSRGRDGTLNTGDDIKSW